jgi:hypothetical protein
VAACQVSLLDGVVLLEDEREVFFFSRFFTYRARLCWFWCLPMMKNGSTLSC